MKDSWRVVNRRDIIPSVPRLMGYCHVAQPVYLSAGDFQGALVGCFNNQTANLSLSCCSNYSELVASHKAMEAEMIFVAVFCRSCLGCCKTHQSNL